MDTDEKIGQVIIVMRSYHRFPSVHCMYNMSFHGFFLPEGIRLFLKEYNCSSYCIKILENSIIEFMREKIIISTYL